MGLAWVDTEPLKPGSGCCWCHAGATMLQNHWLTDRQIIQAERQADWERIQTDGQKGKEAGRVDV